MLTKRDVKDMVTGALGDFFENVLAPYLDEDHKQNQKEHKEIKGHLDRHDQELDKIYRKLEKNDDSHEEMFQRLDKNDREHGEILKRLGKAERSSAKPRSKN